MYIAIHVQCRLFLSDCNETWVISTDFRQIFKYQVLWKSVQWERSYSMGTDGQTDMTALIITFRYFTKAPKMGEACWPWTRVVFVYGVAFDVKCCSDIVTECTGHSRALNFAFAHCTICRISGNGVLLVMKVFFFQGFYIFVTSRGLFCLWLLTFRGICLLWGIISRFLDLSRMKGVFWVRVWMKRVFWVRVWMKETTYCHNEWRQGVKLRL